MHFDVIVVGGSYAGIAAALQVARARRSVLVIDAGLRRNRFASRSHGFLGQDGSEPGEIARHARAQLMEYPTVTWVEDTAIAAQNEPDGFAARGRKALIRNRNKPHCQLFGLRDSHIAHPGGPARMPFGSCAKGAMGSRLNVAC